MSTHNFHIARLVKTALFSESNAPIPPKLESLQKITIEQIRKGYNGTVLEMCAPT